MTERNIKLLIEYDGTNYHGWQRQDNARSVQQVVEEAIARLTQETVSVVAAGRTDAGVHARGQVANFRTQSRLPLHNIYMGINAYLPRDVVVKRAEEAEPEFHARFSAQKRVYHYYILTERTAIFRHYCWQFFPRFDESVLGTLADMLTGEHDFGAFSRVEVQSDHKRCRVYEARWFRREDFLVFRIVANRFLHGMVRTLVGTMMDVARGRFSVQEFQDIFRSRDRTLAGEAAPAKGLFLEEVVY